MNPTLSLGMDAVDLALLTADGDPKAVELQDSLRVHLKTIERNRDMRDWLALRGVALVVGAWRYDERYVVSVLCPYEWRTTHSHIVEFHELLTTTRTDAHCFHLHMTGTRVPYTIPPAFGFLTPETLNAAA